MPLAINPNVPFDYVLDCDRALPKEEQTLFRLKVLTPNELAEIEDGSATFDTNSQQVTIKTGTKVINILKKGLVGVINLKLADGSDVKFTTTKIGGRFPREEADDKFLSYLHPNWRRELANAITEQFRLTEEEEGNSKL